MRLSDGSVVERVSIMGSRVSGVRVLPSGIRLRFTTSVLDWWRLLSSTAAPAVE